MVTKAEMSETTRRNIINTFWKQSFEVGFGKVSVRSIMNDTDMHRSTFYEYFDSLDDLMLHAEKDLLSDYGDCIHSMLVDSVIDNREKFVMMFATMMNDYARKMTLVMSSSRANEFVTRMREGLKPLLIYAYDLKCSEEDMEFITAYYTSVIFGMVTQFGKQGSGEDAIELFSKIQKFIVNGLSPYAGRYPFGRCLRELSSSP